MEEEKLELIEKSLRESLTEAEAIRFREWMATDPEFARQHALLKQVQGALKPDVKAFQQDLQAVMNPAPTAQTRPLFPRSIYRVAAVIVLLIGALAFWWMLSGPPSGADLYAQHFSPPPENLSVRGDSVSYSLGMALMAYQSGQYAEALAAFDQVEPTSPGVRFYRAISLIQTGQITEARTELKLLTGTDGAYQQAAQWYAALTYVQEENWSEARLRLENLSRQSGSSYAQKAVSLIEQLPQ
ncbi:MAG: tetratricopeptide repeat protein [Bacteroidota bacterium]